MHQFAHRAFVQPLDVNRKEHIKLRRHHLIISALQIAVIVICLFVVRASAQHDQENPMSAYQSERMASLETKHDHLLTNQENLSNRIARIEGIGAGFGGVLVLLNLLNLLKWSGPSNRK